MDCLCKVLLFIIIIFLIIFLNLKNNKIINKENYTNVKKNLKGIVFKAAPESNEKLVFADTNGNLNTYDYNDSFSNGLPIKSWKIYEDTNKNLCFKQNDATTGICLTNNNTNSSIKLSNTLLDETILKKRNGLNGLAGWGSDATGKIMPFYIGQYKFAENEWGDWGYTWDALDCVYVNKGFKITLYDETYTGTQVELTNTDSDILPKRYLLNDSNMMNIPYSAKV